MTGQKSIFCTDQTQRNVVAGLCYLAAYFFVYGFIIFRFGLNQDEILDYRGEALDSYQAAGRWGIALYRKLFANGCVPFTAGIVSGIYLAIAYVLQINLLQLKNIGAVIIFGVIGISSPQFTSMQVYSMQVDAVAFGLLLSTISVATLCCASPFTWKVWGIASFLLGISLGMYQTVLAYFAVLYLAVYLTRRESGTQCEAWKTIWQLLVVIISSLIVWQGIVFLTQLPKFIDGPTLHSMNQYQQSLVSSWESFRDFSLIEKLRYVGFIVKQLISCCLGLFYTSGWMVSIVLVPIVLLLIRYYRTRRGYRDFLLRAAIILIIWGLPHLYILCMVNFQGGRLAVAEPLACACLWGLAIRPINLGNKGLIIVCAASLLLLIKSSYNASSAAWQERVEYEQQCAELRSLFNDAKAAAYKHGLAFGTYEIVVVSRNELQQIDPSRPWTSRFHVIHWLARYLNLPNTRGPYQGELTTELIQNLSRVSPWPSPDCYCIRGSRVYIVTARPTHHKIPYSYPIVPYIDQRGTP